MKLTFSNRWLFTSLLALGLLTPSWTVAQMTFERIVVFGTSISDPGNAFALLSHPSHGLTLTKPQTKPQNTPPSYDTLDALLIPGAPYAKGGHHFSNGATWIEQFAQGRGLAGNVRPAFQGNSTEATNYAVGGARATYYPDRVNLPDQITAFRSDYPQLPRNALYVVEMGSNDVRDALADGNPSAITSALAGISMSITDLYAAGARKFLVVNVPNLALLPAVKALGPGAAANAAFLAQTFNTALAHLITQLKTSPLLPDIEVTELDTYDAITNLHDFPENYGLTDVNDPCVTPNTPPFTCQTPDTFLFWDGIHPTKAVHAILAQKVATVLFPAP